VAGDAEVTTFWRHSLRRADVKRSTLNEVELTAQSSTHVFGASHAAALDDLRRAQVELARAWGRGNEDKWSRSADEQAQDVQIDRFSQAEEIAQDRRNQNGTRRRAETDASASTVLSDESTMSSSTARSGDGRSQLEDETAQDIKLASERRAANEAYFKKVDQGVKDVVAKLELVATAMRGVESESRSLWSNSSRSSEATEQESRSRTGGKAQAAQS
jgi:hypothetical protein